MPKLPNMDVCPGCVAPKSPPPPNALAGAEAAAPPPNSDGAEAVPPLNSGGVLAAPPPNSDGVLAAPTPNSDGVEDAAGVDAVPNRPPPAAPPNRLGVDAGADVAPNRLGVEAGVPNSDGAAGVGAADAPPKSDGVEAGVPNSDGAAADAAGVPVAPPQENAGVDGVASAMAAAMQDESHSFLSRVAMRHGHLMAGTDLEQRQYAANCKAFNAIRKP